jgi:Lrp/AsnC family transcriptional regulator
LGTLCAYIGHMDDTDRKILRRLQANPLLTMVELAEQVGLSHTPCWRRVKRLEAEGIIAGRALLLDPKKLGFPISVYAELTIKSHNAATIEAFEEEVSRHPEIVECFSMSGDSDFLMRIVVRSVEDYEAFLKRVLLQLPGVGAVNSRFALKPVKLTQDLPL